MYHETEQTYSNTVSDITWCLQHLGGLYRVSEGAVQTHVTVHIVTKQLSLYIHKWKSQTSPLWGTNILIVCHNKCFKEGITKCSNEVYNKLTNIHQHNKYLLEQ